MDQILYNMLDGILPVMFIFGDSILYYTGLRTTNTILIVTYFKLIVSLMVFAYIGYLYFYKKEPMRHTNNLIDFGINCVVIIILLIIIVIMTKKLCCEEVSIKVRSVPEAKPEEKAK